MTAEEFIRAEGLDFAANLVKDNGLNNFNTPTIASVDNQILTTPNVNVLYTAAAVDTTGGFTLNLPTDDTRLVTAQIINLDTHTTPVHLNKGGVYKYPAGQFDDHVGILVRIGVDSKADAEAQIKVIAEQLSVDAASANPIPDYDLDKLLATRAALKRISGSRRVFGTTDIYVSDNWRPAGEKTAISGTISSLRRGRAAGDSRRPAGVSSSG